MRAAVTRSIQARLSLRSFVIGAQALYFHRAIRAPVRASRFDGASRCAEQSELCSIPEIRGTLAGCFSFLRWYRRPASACRQGPAAPSPVFVIAAWTVALRFSPGAWRRYNELKPDPVAF